MACCCPGKAVRCLHSCDQSLTVALSPALQAAETHTERLDRLRQASSKRQQREDKSKQLKLQRIAKKRARACRQGKQEHKRPGKRQRAQLKLEVFGQAANNPADLLSGNPPEAQGLPGNRGKPPATAKATVPAGKVKRPGGKGKGREPGDKKAAGKSTILADKPKPPLSKQQLDPPTPGRPAVQAVSELKKTVKVSKKKRPKH